MNHMASLSLYNTDLLAIALDTATLFWKRISFLLMRDLSCCIMLPLKQLLLHYEAPSECGLGPRRSWTRHYSWPVSYTHLRAHETPEHLVCRLLLEKKKKNQRIGITIRIKIQK
eukprot:TRINITY_DN6117_c0_g1_i9.p1 TRINITY_DN6117_c0_g1~~TRINITY_DN6117_c0_g1_i9.p1  ORF type:complete len:114 (-),score=9.91 TRINITY_DN6117_c0_g1_i9:43-384(-)